MPELAILVVFFLGLVFGSFATLVSFRVPLSKPIAGGRSKCPSCEHVLTVRDLFPFFSWLLNSGKCRHCKASVSARYPLIELATGLAFVAVFLHFGISTLTPILWAVALCLIIITVIDLEHMIIPDSLNISLLLLGVLYQYAMGAGWQQFVIGPVIGISFAYGLRGLMFAWKKREGLGLGDVKFFGAAGIFLSVEMVPVFLFLSGIIGIVVAGLWKFISKQKEFPFGPALSLSLLVCLVFKNIRDYAYYAVNYLGHFLSKFFFNFELCHKIQNGFTKNV